MSLEAVASFPLEPSRVCSMTGLPAGRLATGHSHPDNAIRVWTADGDLAATLEGHAHAVNVLACTASGDIVSGSGDYTVKVWRDNACLHTLVGHDGSVFLVVVSPLDGIIVSGSADNAKVWSPSTGECLATLEDHSGAMWAVCVLDSGDVVTGFNDGVVRVWQRGSWTCTAVHEVPAPVQMLAPMPLCGFVVSGGNDFGGFLSAWRGGEQQWTLEAEGRVWDLAVVKDVIIASTPEECMVVAEGGVISSWESEETELAVFTDGKVAVCKGHSCTVYRIVRPGRMGAIRILVGAWEAHGGVPPPPSGGDHDAAAALARTLCLRRFCRPRGETGVGRAGELVEPFGQAVVAYL